MIKEIESSSMHNNRQITYIYVYTYVHKSKGNKIFRYFAVTVVDKMEIYSFVALSAERWRFRQSISCQNRMSSDNQFSFAIHLKRK